MLKYTIHRVFGMVPTLIAISIIIFTIIQLPPGDYLETFIAELQAQGPGSQDSCAATWAFPSSTNCR
jgi:peptide/nickel transport system permease protein